MTTFKDTKSYKKEYYPSKFSENAKETNGSRLENKRQLRSKISLEQRENNIRELKAALS